MSPGGWGSGMNIHSRGYVYVCSNASVCNAHVSYGGGLYGQGTSATFESIVVSSGADFNAGQSVGVEVQHTTITQNASFWCYSGVNLSHTTVMPGAFLGVSSGGQCYDVTVASGARIYHHVWGHDSETLVTGSNMFGSFYTSNGTACNYVLVSHWIPSSRLAEASLQIFLEPLSAPQSKAVHGYTLPISAVLSAHWWNAEGLAIAPIAGI